MESREVSAPPAGDVGSWGGKHHKDIRVSLSVKILKTQLDNALSNLT